MAPEWLLWQLADSAFPSGGFAHSGGLEAVWKQGLLSHDGPPEGEEPGNLRGTAAEGFLRTALRHAARGAAPFVVAACREPGRFDEIDQSCDCFLSTHVANRASRCQGQAYLAAAGRVFPVPEVAKFASDCRRRRPLLHWAPVFGVVASALGLDVGQASRLFLFLSLRGWVSASVRLGVVGPLEGQSLQSRLGIDAEKYALIAQGLAPQDAAQTSPLLDLAQGGHDRLYSRLFQT